MTFVPPGFEPPRELRLAALRLEPLGPEHNERDYGAWTSSMDHIRSSPGWTPLRDWPREITVEQNLADLERHARDFSEQTGFTYTVLDESDDVVGCVYVYPAGNGVHDAHVRSWVRASHAELDGVLRRAVTDWLESDAWPFARPLYAPYLR